MSMVIPFPIETVELQAELPSLTYRLDPDRMRIIGMVDGIEAVQQAQRKALVTPRFKCAIYSNQYGSEIKQTIIAGDATPEFIETEMPWIVEDALSQDSRVLGVSNFEYEFKGETVFIRYESDTIFGKTVVEGVI